MSNPAEDYNHVQYCNANSVVVASPDGRLKLVYTPFIVFSLELQQGKRAMFVVSEVRSTSDDKLVYIIGDKAYYHFHFFIDIQF